MPSAARLVAIALGCGLLAFLVTGTFHWAYLAAVGSTLGLAVRASRVSPASRQPTAPVPAD